MGDAIFKGFSLALSNIQRTLHERMGYYEDYGFSNLL